MAEDRQAFKDTMERIGEPCIASKVVNTVEDALDFAKEIAYPVVVRPAYTLGGTGGELLTMKKNERDCIQWFEAQQSTPGTYREMYRRLERN